MFSYSSILRQAYHITVKYPILWLFGLFVIGSFNLNFLNFQNIPLRRVTRHENFHMVLDFFQTHPEVLAAISISVLIFSILGLIVTNWSRIMLVLAANEVVEKKSLQLPLQIKKSWRFLAPVIKISLGTTSLIVVCGLGLFLPPLFLTHNQQLQELLWIMGAAVFIPIVFAVSCVNIFTTFFVVVLKQKLSKALDLGTDFFLSRWTKILGLVMALVVIYAVGFFVGVSVIYFLKLLFRLLFEQFTALPFSVTIWIANAIATVLIWALVAVLNVFFNAALLLLFLQLITPLEAAQKVAAEDGRVVSSPAAAR